MPSTGSCLPPRSAARTVLAHRAGLPGRRPTRSPSPVIARRTRGTGTRTRPGSPTGRREPARTATTRSPSGRCSTASSTPHPRRHRRRVRPSPLSVGPLGLNLNLSFGVPAIGPLGDVLPRACPSRDRRGRKAGRAPGRVRRDPARKRPDSACSTTPAIFNPPRRCVPCSFPAVGVVARARDLARLLAATLWRRSTEPGYSMPAGSRRPCARHTPAAVIRSATEISHFGAGVMLPSPRIPFLGPGSFGHDGHGGSSGRLSFPMHDNDLRVHHRRAAPDRRSEHRLSRLAGHSPPLPRPPRIASMPTRARSARPEGPTWRSERCAWCMCGVECR